RKAPPALPRHSALHPTAECRILREADACSSDSGRKIFVRTGETGVGEKLAPFWPTNSESNDRLFWVFQQRMDGRVNFSRNWSEYEKRIWKQSRVLECLAPSSRRDVTLRIEMTTLDGERFVGEWYGFTIGEVFVGYAMNYKDYLRDRSNISDDALFDSVGMPFSTYDRTATGISDPARRTNGPLPLAQGSAAGFVQLRPGFQTGEWQPMIPPLLTVAGFENQLISLVAGPDQIQQLHLLSPVVASAEPPVVLPLPLAPFKLATTAQHDAARCVIRLSGASEFRAGFYDRRLQFMEQEHLECWRQNRPGERVLDIDIPLSYNLRGIAASPACINAVEVLWQPGAPCAACVKLNCISTEFTTRKHGGEKGVPFRLQIDTFDQDSGDHLCSVAAQVKVFKPKGADRKHKMDFKKFRKAHGRRAQQVPAVCAGHPVPAQLP
uniref:Grh/CP2 DB domain-containing protein n=1 Tax=Macrostomum lignano TaxID=282301 RepID=A0A1I8FIF2_9PLAT